MKMVLRLTRHPADESRISALKAAFGDDLQIIDLDAPYGDDPVKTVSELLKEYGNVVAVEAIAPFPILMKIVDGRRQLGDVLIIRAQFRRGADGRAVVLSKDDNGRDVLAFGYYEVIERVEFQTRKLITE